MKKFRCVIFFVIASLILFSCNQREKKSEENTYDHATDPHYTNANASNYGLQLNNGEKWQADAPTQQSFNRMQKKIDAFAQNNNSPAIAVFNKLGNDIQAELDILFNTCKMEGAAHEQLHNLLKLIIADVKALKGQDEKAAAGAFTDLQKHTQLFPQYFK